MPDDEANDPVLDALWNRVLQMWDEEHVHAALLEQALRTQALPEIAGRYRALVDDPQKSEIAKEKLDAIVIAATQMLMSMKTPKPGKVPLPITMTAFALCLAMLAWLAFALWGGH